MRMMVRSSAIVAASTVGLLEDAVGMDLSLRMSIQTLQASVSRRMANIEAALERSSNASSNIIFLQRFFVAIASPQDRVTRWAGKACPCFDQLGGKTGSQWG